MGKIESEHQYRVTKERIAGFEHSIQDVEKSDMHPERKKLYIEVYGSQLASLREEAAEWEEKRLLK